MLTSVSWYQVCNYANHESCIKQNIDFKVLYPKFTDFDVRYYILELLKVVSVITMLHLLMLMVPAITGFGLLPFQGYHAS